MFPGGGRGTVRIAVLDGHTLLAQSLEAALGQASEGRIEVVGTAGTVDAGLRLVEQTGPDVVLVDLALPPAGAVEVLAGVRRLAIGARLMVMSADDDLDGAMVAMAAGADAFLAKTARPEELLAPLLAVVQGWTVVSRPLAEHLLVRGRRRDDSVRLDLTDRDRRLWTLVARGLDTVSIAEHLFVSERTAKRLVADLRVRLGVRTRIEMASLAGRVGLLDDVDLADDGDPPDDGDLAGDAG